MSARRGQGGRLGGQTLWATAGRLASTAGSFVVAGIGARLLDQDDFGALLLAISISTVGGGIARLGLDRAVVRLAADRRERGSTGEVRAVVRTTGLLGTASSLAALALLAGPPGHWLAADVLRSTNLDEVMAAVAVWTAAESARRVWSEPFRGLGEIPAATSLGDGLRSAALAVALAVLLMLDGSPTLSTVTWTAALTTVGVAGVALVSLAVRARSLGPAEPSEHDRPRAVLRIALPMLGASLGGMLVGQGDLWVVGRYLGEDVLASYGAALRLGMLLLVPLLVVNNVVPPIVVRLHARGAHDELEVLLRGYTGLATIPVLVAGAVLTVAGGPLLELLFGEFARDGWGVLVALAASQVVAVASGSCGIALLMTGHERAVVAATLLSSALLLGSTSAVAAGGGSPTAVAAASGLSTVALNVALVVHAKRVLGIWTHASLSPRTLRALRTVDVTG